MDKLKQDKIKLLKLSRKLIKNGSVDFICDALTGANFESPYPFDPNAVRQLKNYISNSLGDKMWLAHWQRDVMGLSRSQCERISKSSRLQWIDWMICSLEDKPYMGVPFKKAKK